MATRKVLLDEDVTGLLSDNHIQGEGVDIGIGRNRLLRFEYGAFFEEGLKLLDLDGNEIDRDKYTFCDIYIEAARKSAKPVWNAIVINDQTVPSKLSCEYHAYGGRFAVNGRILVEWLNEKLATIVDPIEWLALRDRPKEWTPKFHKHLWSEVYGWSYFKRPLDNIENAIRLDTSYFYELLIRDIQRKLEQANQRAMALANFYATKAVTDATINISKEKLGIHLLANLTTATPLEMERVAREDFDSALLTEDKYINKKGLIAFTQVLHERSVKIADTNLGTKDVYIRESKKGALIGLPNAGIAFFKSKAALIQEGLYYEDNVYPKNYPSNDQFTALRVTHNLKDHGGVFLGFNNTTGEMFSGVLTDDRCFMRIKWYKFYSELTYNSIKVALADHVKATNNPHQITKEQVMLEKVKNLPVATIEQILSGEPVDAYLTLDGLQMLMAKELLNLKPEFKEDGSLNKDSDLFNKPNIIFTPCDKKVPDNYPPKGQMLKTYCDGSDRFMRLADGEGGFTDEVLELNSDDCNFVENPKQGTDLGKTCKGKDQYTIVADGRGGKTEVLSAMNSSACGYQAPPAEGTVLGEECRGKDMVRKYADGNGGSTTAIVEINAPTCGFTTTTLAPTTTVKPAEPGKPSIILYGSHTNIEKGTSESFTAHFTNFPPNQPLAFLAEQREPAGALDGGKWKDWYAVRNEVVNIDSSGAGTWSLTVVDDGITTPRNTTWNNRLITTDNVVSNVIIRNFVAAGQGGDPGNTPPPVPTTTPAPATTKPRITITPTPWRVNGMHLSVSVTIELSGGAPSTNYYFRLIQRRHPWTTFESMGQVQETFNGVIGTNAAGNGKFFSSFATIYSHLIINPGIGQKAVDIYDASESYIVLDDGTWSDMFMIYHETDPTYSD